MQTLQRQRPLPAYQFSECINVEDNRRAMRGGVMCASLKRPRTSEGTKLVPNMPVARMGNAQAATKSVATSSAPQPMPNPGPGRRPTPAPAAGPRAASALHRPSPQTPKNAPPCSAATAFGSRERPRPARHRAFGCPTTAMPTRHCVMHQGTISTDANPWIKSDSTITSRFSISTFKVAARD